MSAECVHCGAPMKEAAARGGVMVKGLFGLASAGMAAITLMACYGMPPCEEPAPDGGEDAYHCYDTEPMCAAPDGGDGGEWGPCEDVFSPDAGQPGADGGVDGGP